MTTLRRRFLCAIGAVLLVGLLSACGLAESGGGGGGVTLRLSHQWPGASEGEGDFRAVLAQRFAQVKENKRRGYHQDLPQQLSDRRSRTTVPGHGAGNHGYVGLPTRLRLGRRAGSITLMPAMVRNHAQAQNWQDAEIGNKVEEMAEENGIKILTWVWNAGAIGVKEESIVSPDDVRSGMVTRAAGPRVEEMLKRVGFGLASMDSSEIYNAMQTGTLDSAITYFFVQFVQALRAGQFLHLSHGWEHVLVHVRAPDN